MPREIYLFLIAGSVGHLQILIQEVQAQLVNWWFKEIVFHEAREKRWYQHQLIQLLLFESPPFHGFCF